nr:ABC transporter substrate-binding protein [Roseomonas aerilata]
MRKARQAVSINLDGSLERSSPWKPLRNQRLLDLSKVGGALLYLFVTVSVGAQELRIGLAAAPTSFDPHFHAHAPSLALHQHVFESLIERDASANLIPSLAESWSPLADGLGWEVVLDRRARFSTGEPVRSADVAASLARVATIPSSPGRHQLDLTSVVVLDELRLQLRTASPSPLLPTLLPAVLIVPHQIAQNAATADFNRLFAAVGSGPYRVVGYRNGEGATLERNDSWWRGIAKWNRVTFKVLSADASRVAALRSGDVDAVEAVPPRDFQILARDSRFAVHRRTGFRLLFLVMDQARAISPDIRAPDGRNLPVNPLQDRRVRQALSSAINRDALVHRIMDGQATSAGQFLPDGAPGYDAAIAPDKFEPEEARRLLRDAGWPDGLRIILAGPSDRYVNDDRVLQAVAQMWERIGIKTEVDAVPSGVFFSRLARGDFSAALYGWSHASGEPNTYFEGLLATPDRRRGRGAANFLSYSNAALDQIIERALVTTDQSQRLDLWSMATKAAFRDQIALIPLYHQVNTWATKRDLNYAARADEFTLADQFYTSPPP